MSFNFKTRLAELKESNQPKKEVSIESILGEIAPRIYKKSGTVKVRREVLTQAVAISKIITETDATLSLQRKAEKLIKVIRKSDDKIIISNAENEIAEITLVVKRAIAKKITENTEYKNTKVATEAILISLNLAKETSIPEANSYCKSDWDGARQRQIVTIKKSETAFARDIVAFKLDLDNYDVLMFVLDALVEYGRAKGEGIIDSSKTGDVPDLGLKLKVKDMARFKMTLDDDKNPVWNDRTWNDTLFLKSIMREIKEDVCVKVVDKDFIKLPEFSSTVNSVELQELLDSKEDIIESLCRIRDSYYDIKRVIAAIDERDEEIDDRDTFITKSVENKERRLSNEEAFLKACLTYLSEIGMANLDDVADILCNLKYYREENGVITVNNVMPLNLGDTFSEFQIYKIFGTNVQEIEVKIEASKEQLVDIMGAYKEKEEVDILYISGKDKKFGTSANYSGTVKISDLEAFTMDNVGTGHDYLDLTLSFKDKYVLLSDADIETQEEVFNDLTGKNEKVNLDKNTIYKNIEGSLIEMEEAFEIGDIVDGDFIPWGDNGKDYIIKDIQHIVYVGVLLTIEEV